MLYHPTARILTSNCTRIGIRNEHPVSDAIASFQLTPSGAIAQPIAARIRGIAPGPKISDPASLDNVEYALEHLVEPPRCIALFLESPACQKSLPTISRGPRSTSWPEATAQTARR